MSNAAGPGVVAAADRSSFKPACFDASGRPTPGLNHWCQVYFAGAACNPNQRGGLGKMTSQWTRINPSRTWHLRRCLDVHGKLAVMCGRPPRCKGFFDAAIGNSGAVMCPASGCGAAWPRALMVSADRAPIIPTRSGRVTICGISRSPVCPVAIITFALAPYVFRVAFRWSAVLCLWFGKSATASPTASGMGRVEPHKAQAWPMPGRRQAAAASGR